MAWIELDYNFKKLAFFFQVLPVYFGEIAENRFIVCSLLEKSVNILLPVFNEELYAREKFLC